MNHQLSESGAETHNGTDNLFDVLILGGGYAGGALALHLSLHMPELSVAVVEPNPKPPRYAHKVGESSLSPQGTYLVQWLGLEQYLHQAQVEKFGARYFFGDTTGPFVERPEVGARHAVAEYPIYEFQVDRGKLEYDLRQMVSERGVTWLTYMATDVQLGQGDALHTVQIQDRANGAKKTLRTRWVVDASGRRRLLHRSRHATVSQTGRCSAAWFRVMGWIDVADFVPATEVAWHERVAPKHPRGIPFGRVNSTTHLCGTGYWVWLIPLPDDGMSVGIVAEEAIIPFELYNTPERALDWLAANEPYVFAAVENLEWLDFRTMRRYSYPANDFVSAERWALIGEALGFSDPFYSPGGDMISLANLIVVETIRRERNGTIDEETCQRLTASVRRILAIITDGIQSIYPCLGASRVAGAHVIWDFLSLVTPMFLVIRNFNAELYDYLASDEAHGVIAEIASLRQELDPLMLTWAQGDCAQLAPRTMLDHAERLGQLTGHLWSETSGKDLSSLTHYLLDHLKAIADKYRTQGVEWALFDATWIECSNKPVNALTGYAYEVSNAF
jgi:2-polyprenyl-6-methoxyphenol hydroxylase-like FAD-dependent oxidoreductase